MRGAKGREGEGRGGVGRGGEGGKEEAARDKRASRPIRGFILHKCLPNTFQSGSRAVIHGGSQNQQGSKGRPGADV